MRLMSQINIFETKSMFIHVHILVLQRDLPSLDGKHEHFVNKKVEKAVAKPESDRL